VGGAFAAAAPGPGPVAACANLADCKAGVRASQKARCVGTAYAGGVGLPAYWRLRTCSESGEIRERRWSKPASAPWVCVRLKKQFHCVLIRPGITIWPNRGAACLEWPAPDTWAWAPLSAIGATAAARGGVALGSERSVAAVVRYRQRACRRHHCCSPACRIRLPGDSRLVAVSARSTCFLDCVCRTTG
jgi:hypothetical protein